jgi:hypothetical protein
MLSARFTVTTLAPLAVSCAFGPMALITRD